MIDYRELIKKYIHLVGEEEGISFINKARNYPHLSKEEVEELEKLEQETFRSKWDSH